MLPVLKGYQMNYTTSRSFPHSWLITGFVTRVTWPVPLLEQVLLTLPEHMSSPPVFSGVRVTRSFVFCVVFWRSYRCLSFCPFSFGHCVVYPFLIHKFWLPIWYQTNILYIISVPNHWLIGQIIPSEMNIPPLEVSANTNIDI